MFYILCFLVLVRTVLVRGHVNVGLPPDEYKAPAIPRGIDL